MKKYFILYLGIPILLLTATFGCTRNPGSEGIQCYSEFKKLFTDPPSEYRSAPLWDWNEQITEEGIDFEMKELKKAGIGGVFVHPRPGLLTEYLSDDWFHLFDYTVQKGKELGMKVWIYDENSYPSGFAGGHVPAEMPDSYKHGTGLVIDTLSSLNIQMSDTIEVILKKTGTGYTDITASADQERGKKGTYYVFRKTYPQKSLWYGGFSYVDLLYKGVTEKFIDITMTRGYERNIADFGKTLSGSFSDEPNLDASMARGSLIRWTPDLWNVFRKRWGYDLRTHLLSLIGETGNWKKVRHDYYEVLLELFVDRWAKPLSKYCEEKGLKWTGHYWEHGWPEPTHICDESAIYMWHQQPGVDMLGNRYDTLGLGGQFGNDRAVRELRSVANQAGRVRTLSETYGGGGWELNFENQKRFVDWECVTGVNFVNQHLSYYSLNGIRKFDFPPSFSYHEPWWAQYKLLGNYIGRVCMAMSSGQQINKTLLLQPNTSAWMYFSRKEKNPEIDTIHYHFVNFVYRMEQLQLEYDLGSEYVMKVLGSVNGNQLRIGQRDYNLVVIPVEMENIDRSTYDMLKKYLENGGKVLSFRKEISLIDGKKSDLVNKLAAKSEKNWFYAERLNDTKALQLLVHDDFTMKDETRNGMLYHQRRILNDGQLLFVVNSNDRKKAEAEVTVDGNYVTMFDLVTGKKYEFPAKSENGKVSFHISLDPVGSILLGITDRQPAGLEPAPASGMGKIVKCDGPVTVKRESDNVLMVSYLDLKTSESDLKDVYFMKAQNNLYTENGIEKGNPWNHKIQYKKNYLELDSLFKAGSGFEASYHLHINPDLSTDAMKSVRAVVERSGLWTVNINGHELKKIPDVYWADRNFHEFSLWPYLKPGDNILTLKAQRMNILAEIMPVYFLGDFLVEPLKQGFGITGGTFGTLGSWSKNGMPFYPGKVGYSENFSIEKNDGMTYRVKLNRWDGIVSEVFVNSKSAGMIAWQPDELDITPFIRNGENEITIKVTGSLKSPFGFFYRESDTRIFGPGSWKDAPEKSPSVSAYFFMNYGLFEPFDIIETKK